MFSYTIYGGETSEWLIGFYGFGQSANVYKGLYELIKDTHNLLVVDLPSRTYTADYRPQDIEQYLRTIIRDKGIQRFQTISFSMGSRLNLFIPEYFPEQIAKMILVAPDGIKINIWNRLAVHTLLGQSLFKFFVRNKNAYLNLIRLLYNLRVLNKSLYTFSKWNMRDHDQRMKVYNAWMNMRYLVPDLRRVNECIEKQGIELRSYFGKQDAVIPLHIYKKCRRVFPTGIHHLIDADHNIMNEEFFTLLAQEIKK